MKKNPRADPHTGYDELLGLLGKYGLSRIDGSWCMELLKETGYTTIVFNINCITHNILTVSLLVNVNPYLEGINSVILRLPNNEFTYDEILLFKDVLGNGVSAITIGLKYTEIEVNLKEDINVIDKILRTITKVKKCSNTLISCDILMEES